MSTVLLVQTLQINHINVLGAQTSGFFPKISSRASESDDQYILWRERLKTRPDWRDGWVVAGRLALESKRYDEALIAVNHSLLIDPNHEESRVLLGEILDARSK